MTTRLHHSARLSSPAHVHRVAHVALMAERQRQAGEADAVVLEASNLSKAVSCARLPLERVLDADKETPDDWVPRSPELIRLTGAAHELARRIAASRRLLMLPARRAASAEL